MLNAEEVDAKALQLETRIALESLNLGIESLIARKVHVEDLEPLANLSRQAVEAFETLTNFGMSSLREYSKADLC